MTAENHSLTSRELHIVRLLLKSYSQKMIAEELNISIETVKSHFKRLRLKLGVHSTPQIINWAHEQGISKYPSATTWLLNGSPKG